MQTIERLASGEDVVSEFNDVGQLLEQAEEYYDTLGLSLSMAILKNNTIVLSSKHWMNNCYIEVEQIDNNNKFVFGLWDIITCVSRDIGRELDRTPPETGFVFVSNLNRNQTLKVYDAIIRELGDRKLDFDVIKQFNFFGWNVTEQNTVKIPWIVGIDWN